MNLLTSLRNGNRAIQSLEDYANALAMYDWQLNQPWTGTGIYPYGMQQTLSGQSVEEVNANFTGLAQAAYKGNGIVFSCMLVRQMVFSTARFTFQRLRNGSPSGTFSSPALSVFERPWVGGTTQDLLARIIQDADLAGNAFTTNVSGEIVRLRPDWVDIVVERRMLNRPGGGQLGWRKIGYLYWENGRMTGDDPVALLPSEVAHFMPNPDPEAQFRGLSWLTPIVREIQADGLMNKHKRKYFENGATPNMVIKHNVSANEEKVLRFAERLRENHAGVDNAYKTLNLYPGADLTVVGSDFRQIDFKQVQGAGETRIAAAAGVPPVIVGLSEGLQAATYSNYSQARRRLADGTAHPLWQNVAGSMEPLLSTRPPGTDWRLWYDVSDVPFLREDAADAANIAHVKAQTVRSYCDAGFTPESAIAAVENEDIGLLEHTGLFSVQLQPPGTTAKPAVAPADTTPADQQTPPAKAPAKPVPPKAGA